MTAPPRAAAPADPSAPPTSAPRFVLASASPARLATLRRAGFDPEVVVSGVEEEGVDGGGPAATALLLAARKAEAVAELISRRGGAGVLVLGCDSLLDLDGTAYGKPADAAAAVAQWQRMRGGSGVLHTGHCLLRGERRAVAVASTVVRFGDIDDADIRAYVATGEPLAVAGAFTVDGLGGPFVDGIDGDHHNVVGLSLPVLRGLLASVGVRVTDLWRPRI